MHEVTEKATLLFPYRALPCLGLEGSTCCSVSWRCCYQSPGHPLTAACVFAAAQMKLTMGFSLKATFSDSDVPCPVHIPPSRPDGGHAQDSMLLAGVEDVLTLENQLLTWRTAFSISASPKILLSKHKWSQEPREILFGWKGAVPSLSGHTPISCLLRRHSPVLLPSVRWVT